MDYTVINSNKVGKFFRKKASGEKVLLVEVLEQLPFGKVRVALYYNDKSFPYWAANYLGNDIVEEKDLFTEKID